MSALSSVMASPRTPRALLVTLVALLASAGVHAKPLYITVTRSYGTNEAPNVDVAFEAKGPVELRVLQPNDLGAYLAKQENLRRTWERPASLDNPGRALSRGWNAMRMPGTYLLFSLDEEMRQALGGALKPRPEAATEVHARVAEGDKKLVGVPPEMTVVQRQWLNLDLGGESRAFDVPGFEGWSSTSSGFQERRVVLRPLPAGVYVLQLVQGTIEGQVILVVTDLTVAVKQTDGRALVRVADRAQLPVKGASVSVTRVGAPPLSAVTDEKGEAWVDVKDTRLVVLASRAGDKGVKDTAIVDTDFYSSLAASPDVFLYSDRPIYRAGDTVKFRGIARRPDGFLARLFAPKNPKVKVALAPAEGDTSKNIETTIAIDDNGSFTGGLQVPDGSADGVWRLVATLDDKPHLGELRVQEYVKPTFFIEVTTDSESIVPGTKLKAKLRAERYAGGAPDGTAYEVTLTRSSVEAPAWVDDAGMGGKGSAVTYGSASTTEGKLSVPDRVYSSLAERLEAGDASYDDPWASAPTFDEKGRAEIEIDVPALKPGEERIPFKYTLAIRARDDQGTFAGASVPLFLSPVDVMGALRVSKKVQMQTQPAELVVRSTTLSGKPAPHTTGTVQIVSRTVQGDESPRGAPVAIETDDAGVARVPIPTDRSGTVLARVVLKDKKGAEWTGEDKLLVVGTGGEPVEWVPELALTSTTDVLDPGERAEVVALLPDEWGPKGAAAGPLWLTLSGTTLFSTRLIEAKGQTVVIPFDVEKRFGSAVYVTVGYPTRSGRWEERTAPFRIVPKERVLTITAEAQRAEVEPLGEQTVHLHVTDAAGRPVQAQLSIGVVDKAVYAVQREFRPSALEFFYPLVRNNVATFTSAEFQGYGYGHMLARRALDGGTRFAAVKPPKKKTDERDTAYWNGDVRTDAAGNASVTFRMPSNQTLWTITTVAADARGRVGEGLAQFASRGNGTVSLAMPLHLRVGDEAAAVVRVARPTAKSATKPWTSALALSAVASGPITASLPTATADLTSAREQVLPLQLKATSAGVATVSMKVQAPQGPLVDVRTLEIDDGVITERASVSRSGAGELALPLPAGAKAVGVELVLQGSLTDAAMQDLRELLVYPHGCLEQLVATTTPSLALIAALEAQGGVERLDAESQALLLEARSRAQQGVARILQYATKKGGFSWFGGESDSLDMTLIAVAGLAPAIEQGVLSGRDARVDRAAKVLESADLASQPILDAWRTYALSRAFSSTDPKRVAARARELVARAAGAPETSPVVGALAVLAAEASGVAAEAGTKDSVIQLAGKARAAFLARTRADLGDLYWRFPLGDTGALALLANAARLEGKDTGPLLGGLLDLFTRDDLSTFDRATVIMQALPFVVAQAKDVRAMAAPSVDGAGKVTFAPRGAGLAAKLPDGTKAVKLGAFSGVATLTASVQTPYASAPPINEGFAIGRKYFAVGSGAMVEIKPGDVVHQGDVVFVQLQVDLHEDKRWGRDRRSAYSVVEDNVPAGFTPLQEDKEYRGAPLSLPLTHERVKRRSFQTDRVTFYVEDLAWWMGQPSVLGYVMRADFAGKFTAPPATVEDMYQRQARGRTSTSTLIVVPSSNAK